MCLLASDPRRSATNVCVLHTRKSLVAANSVVAIVVRLTTKFLRVKFADSKYISCDKYHGSIDRSSKE